MTFPVTASAVLTHDADHPHTDTTQNSHPARRAELTAIRAELTELAADDQIARRMPDVATWRAEISEMQLALHRRAMELCQLLGQHQRVNCPSCTIAPTRPAGS